MPILPSVARGFSLCLLLLLPQSSMTITPILRPQALAMRLCPEQTRLPLRMLCQPISQPRLQWRHATSRTLGFWDF